MSSREANERLDELDNEYGAENMEVTIGPDYIYAETDTGVIFRINVASGKMCCAPVDWTEEG